MLVTPWIAWFAACMGGGAPAPQAALDAPPSTPRVVTAGAVDLVAHAEDARWTLPERSRPEVPTAIHPVEPFRRAGGRGPGATWRTALPVDMSLFLEPSAGARTFGNWSPAGLEVKLDGEPLRFARRAAGPGTWGWSSSPPELLVTPPADTEPPTPDRVTVTWPKATAVERGLHRATAGTDGAAFARRTVRLGTLSHRGLLLPAPTEAVWTVTVPADGVFHATARILPHAIRSATPNDGAQLVVRVGDQAVATFDVGDTPAPVRADLSAHAGQTVELTLATTPGATSDGDLVFLEDPTLYTPSDDPIRIVVAFVDTVRPDRLSIYGAARDTTPKLAAWAASGVRFDDHRTVAPWTLPSTRAALTGVQPERFHLVPTLPERLDDAGFHTHAIVANAYLSAAFGTHRGFDTHSYQILQPASDTIDQALAVLDAHPDRDVLLWVQFMEAHLPYQEPPAYRDLFAGPKPDALQRVALPDLRRMGPGKPDFEAVEAYVHGRYDQNLRVLDDEVDRLFDAVGDDAVTVLFSDHGEEFWDHGGFEHGHQFHDELLKVPFVVRAPGLAPGVVEAPTSLLDLTPTVLDLVGLDADVTPGTSLVSAARGDDAALAQLRDRPQGFGRPLYGADGWGVVHEGQKWWARGDEERLYDLTADPGEALDLAASGDTSGFPALLADALDREVPAVWRVDIPGFVGGTVTVQHPAGVTAAWPGYDPRAYHAATTVSVADGVATVDVARGTRVPFTLFVQPAGDLTTAPTVMKGVAPVPRVRAVPTFAPAPDGGVAVPAWDDEVGAQLELLGYRERDEE